MSDSRTVEKIVTTMEARHGVIGRVWIADRGMSSRANLQWLRSSGRRYIIGAPKSELKKHAALLAEARGWHPLREGVEVRLTRCAETRGHRGACPLGRAARERARDAREVLSADRSGACAPRRAHRTRSSPSRSGHDPAPDRAAAAREPARRGALRISLVEAKSPAGFHLSVKINEAFDQWAEISEGAYALKTQRHRLER